jgi:hypothetical protein
MTAQELCMFLDGLARVGVRPLVGLHRALVEQAEHLWRDGRGGRGSGWSRKNFPQFGHGARFRQKFTLEDAIGPHASSLEASRRVTNGIPLGCPRFLPVHTVNCVQTLKAHPRFSMGDGKARGATTCCGRVGMGGGTASRVAIHAAP